MTEQEKADLEKLQAEVARIRMVAFSDLRDLDRATSRDLEMQGMRGKTTAEAMQVRFRHYVKQIEKLQAEHVRKYPD